MVTYAMLRRNEAVNTYIDQADKSLKALGYTEHSFAHVTKFAETAGYILTELGYGEHETELVKIAGFLHDIGNLVNRIEHSQSGAVMAFFTPVRVICQNMQKGVYHGEARIYGHAEVIEQVHQVAHMLLGKKQTKYIGDRVHLIAVADGETREIQGNAVTFFDIQSTKSKQFGFRMTLPDGKSLTCCGDEPYRDCEENYAQNSDWLLHEAFCLDAQADIFHPYEKSHSTAKDACQTAEKLGVKNLVLYHTEDKNIARRRELYTAEGQPYFSGNLYVPDDLDVIEL